MGSDETPETGTESSRANGAREELRKAQDRLEEGADKAVDGFDERIVDLLSWVLDTETRARIFVYLREQPNSTSEEIADGTGLYPSTVREALAELHEESKVERGKRENSGAGNNPYEYEAIAPSELVRGVVEQVQAELNTVFNLDSRLGGDAGNGESGPVQISVETSDDSEGDVRADSDAEVADGGTEATDSGTETSDADSDDVDSDDADSE